MRHSLHQPVGLLGPEMVGDVFDDAAEAVDPAVGAKMHAARAPGPG